MTFHQYLHTPTRIAQVFSFHIYQKMGFPLWKLRIVKQNRTDEIKQIRNILAKKLRKMRNNKEISFSLVRKTAEKIIDCPTGIAEKIDLIKVLNNFPA